MEQYYLYFLVYSLLGWCMETVRFSLREKRFVNRGFLNGPLCPVYGFGMIIILYCLGSFFNNIFLLFFMGAILASLLEYITGFALERLFYTRWWDYSKDKYNIHGYVCLRTTLAWGFLCVLMIRLVQPVVVNLVDDVNVILLNRFVVLSFFVLVVDCVVTIANLGNLKGYITNLEKVRTKLKNRPTLKLEVQKLHERLNENHISLKEYLYEIKHLGDEEQALIKERLLKVQYRNNAAKRQLKRLFNNYQTVSSHKKYVDEANIIKNDLENR